MLLHSSSQILMSYLQMSQYSYQVPVSPSEISLLPSRIMANDQEIPCPASLLALGCWGSSCLFPLIASDVISRSS